MTRPKVPPALSPIGTDRDALGAPATGESLIRRTFEGPAPTPAENLVFVIMSFEGEGMDEVYPVIQDECRKLGLLASRVDENVGSGFVLKEIGDLIEKAGFIICDLTYERPNVYYELGYAHGVGNHAMNVLLIAREGTRLHFDIGPLRVHYYASAEKLRALLTRNLTEMIRARRSGARAAPGRDDDTA